MFLLVKLGVFVFIIVLHLVCFIVFGVVCLLFMLL